MGRALVLIGCLAAAACSKGPPPKPPPPNVGVVVIRPQPVELTTLLPGRTSPYAVSDVRPQVGGILKARLFEEGSNVKAGAVLYQIDPAPYVAAYNNAKGVLVAAKAKADRYAALVKLLAVARQDYDDAVAAYQQALANAQAAAINLGYTKITAPISGRISRSSVTQGALLTADQTTALATIQTLDPIYVDITQSSTELLSLKQAMQNGRMTDNGPMAARATIQLDNGTAYDQVGTLQFSEVTVDQSTGQVTLRAIFPNPQGVLLPGMFVRTTIVEGVAQNAILAPQQGVSRNEKGDPIVYIVDAKGIARLRPIKTSRAIGDKWLVTDGLKAGDRLIVEGLQNVAADQPVHAVAASFAGPANPGPR
ncbi:MAG TPA: efflux RND transporter periplasmic adaptor subunit [Rhizomicrobium sp.]|nr:efflux RND transporter periplasmic adaptor subunit [Rhizomicrobium sp.]